MNESIEIRVAADADLPAITAIYNQAIALRYATAHTDFVTVDDRRHWLSEHSPDKYPVYVADYKQAVSGYCSLSAYRPGPYDLAKNLLSCEVAPDPSRSFYVSDSDIGGGIPFLPTFGIRLRF